MTNIVYMFKIPYPLVILSYYLITSFQSTTMSNSISNVQTTSGSELSLSLLESSALMIPDPRGFIKPSNVKIDNCPWAPKKIKQRKTQEQKLIPDQRAFEYRPLAEPDMHTWAPPRARNQPFNTNVVIPCALSLLTSSQH